MASTTSEIIVSADDHIDPKRDDGYLIVKLGYVNPVSNNSRSVSMLWGNFIGSGSIATVQKSLAIRFYGVTPYGLIDGVNKVFTLNSIIMPNEEVFQNGKQLIRGRDYTIEYDYITIITLNTALEENESLLVDYSLFTIGDRYYAQIPVGAINDVNTEYYINADIEENEEVYQNGVLLVKGIGYEIDYDTVTTITLPSPLEDDSFSPEAITVNFTPKSVGTRYYNKTLTGDINGINKAYVLLKQIEPNEVLFQNGIRLTRGVHYNILYLNATAIEMVTALEVGETLVINYTQK